LNAKVDEALTAVSSSVEGMRTLIFELRPMSLDEEGLAAALREYRRNLGPDLEFTVDDRISHEPTRETRVILYRIAQEALVNVRKHAKATRVEVLLEEQRGGYLVRVQDNGVGFSAAETRSRNGHLGLSSMKERAEMAGGKCEIRRRPEGGTSVEFWLPERAAQALKRVDRKFAERGAA
jgi:signal transduction histidine kinase